MAAQSATKIPTPTIDEGRRVPRPFLKWVGGKGQLLDQFEPLLPPDLSKGRYFEPFLGGAALFFSLVPPRATLTDVNPELVDCYRAVKDAVDDLVQALRKHTHGEEHYYRVRAQDPRKLSTVARAARTIYLNKTGFNGLYRVNSSGRFNVPFGRYANPTICDERNLRACARALAKATLAVRGFEGVLEDAKRGDFVYFDPPYVPVSDTADFTSYAAGGFDMEDQARLAKTFRALAKRGVRVMLSNSDTPAVRELYAGFRIDVVRASRSINSRPDKRGKVGEVVVRSYG